MPMVRFHKRFVVVFFPSLCTVKEMIDVYSVTPPLRQIQPVHKHNPIAKECA